MAGDFHPDMAAVRQHFGDPVEDHAGTLVDLDRSGVEGDLVIVLDRTDAFDALFRRRLGGDRIERLDIENVDLE